MKIIDEKGRLFGKINMIDFSVIILFLSLTPMFYFGYKIFNPKPPQAETQKQQEKVNKEPIEIKIATKFVKLKPDIVGMITVGDKEKDADGNTIGEIMSIGGFNPYEREIEIGQDRRLINKDPSLRQTEVTLRINAEIRDKNIYYKDKQVVENGMFIFSPGKYSAVMEGVTIVKDDYNVVVMKQERPVIEKDNSLEVLKDGLNALENKVDSSLSQVENRLSELENKGIAKERKRE
jgi:hypothetical protein